MNSRTLIIQLPSIAVFLIVCTLAHSLSAQQPEFNQDEALRQAEQAMRDARLQDLNVFSPRHFSKAESSLEEAKSLIQRKRERELIRLRLRGCLEELDEARKTAKLVIEKIGDVVKTREAARQAGAERLPGDAWKKAEEKMYAACRDVERGKESIPNEEVEVISGAYRAVRREALRKEYLSAARAKIEDAERAGAGRATPSLLVRAQQAIGRAEAALSQENLDLARIEADNATRDALHSMALMKYITESGRKANAWESAILPYDDILSAVAERLGGSLDFSFGGAATQSQLLNMIAAREESLATQLASEKTMRDANEQSLIEAQTALADCQGRLTQLEQRFRAAEGERSASREALLKKQDIASRVQRAQEHFKPGEAVVHQNEQGQVVIRIYGISFTAGQSTLDKSQKKIMEKVASAVKEFDNPTITVEGHTDSDGKDETNQALSEERALEVGSALADALKIRADTITAIGYGESRPIADNNSKEGKSRNRRIDVVLTLP